MSRDHDDELPLPRVQPRVLRQEVLAALRAAILAGDIKMGSRLLEADVAARMGVSRAPVREAMRQLEQEGLVESFAHRGAVVIGLPEDEIDAIYELRALIESKAIERATSVVTPENLTTLDGYVDEMLDALSHKDIEQVTALDLLFHGRIVELSGFSLLRHIWSSLDGLVRVRSYQALGRPATASAHLLREDIASHTLLVDAMRAGDAALASARIQEHILDVPARMNEDHATAKRASRSRAQRRPQASTSI